MCLMMFLGCDNKLEVRKGFDLTIEDLTSDQEAVRIILQKPNAYFVGSHSGCSCGFPSLWAEEPLDYWEGLFDKDADGREADLRSVRELLSVMDECLVGAGTCALWPVWNGSAKVVPKGRINWKRVELNPETFVVTEQFLYTIHARL